MQVLVIDDSRLVRERLAALLSGIAGVEAVLQADGSRQAMAVLEGDAAHTVHFIVLDIEMPELSGLQLLPMIRKARQDVQIAMLTHHADAQHRARSLSSGANYFFDKGRDIDQLESTVRTVAASTH